MLESIERKKPDGFVAFVESWTQPPYAQATQAPQARRGQRNPPPPNPKPGTTESIKKFKVARARRKLPRLGNALQARSVKLLE